MKFKSKITQDILKQMWELKDIESKRKLALGTLAKMKDKNINVIEIEREILKTNSMYKIDKAMTDLYLVSEDLKVN